MTSTLFKPPPVDGNLGERQAFVLELVRERPEGVTETEASATGTRRAASTRPLDAATTARARGAASSSRCATKRELVTRRRSGVWTIADREPSAIEGHDPATGEIPY